MIREGLAVKSRLPGTMAVIRQPEAAAGAPEEIGVGTETQTSGNTTKIERAVASKMSTATIAEATITVAVTLDEKSLTTAVEVVAEATARAAATEAGATPRTATKMDETGLGTRAIGGQKMEVTAALVAAAAAASAAKMRQVGTANTNHASGPALVVGRMVPGNTTGIEA